MGFRFERLEIPEVVLVEADGYDDERGWFAETYKRSEFARAGIEAAFVQDNVSRSAAGVLRGLHLQNPPQALGKLVSVLEGEVFDVAVDVRRGSPTFGRWVGERLSAKNHRMLWVPEGFAHGFVTVTDAVVAYKMTGEYAPHHERAVRWNDPAIGIEWPVAEPLLSKKDAEAPLLGDADIGFVFREG